MKSLKFLSFNKSPKEQQNPPTTKQNALLRRREQLRKAQRTYRERKEEYVKSLEDEIVRLRANEANIMQETRRLYTEISTLKNLLTQHGIPLPPSTHPPSQVDSPHSQDDSVSTLFIGKSLQDGNQIHVRKGSQAASQYQFSNSSESDSGPSPQTLRSDQESWTISSIFTSTSKRTVTVEGRSREPSQPKTKRLIADLDYTAVGMEFVLTLEGPCLGHIQGDPKKPHELTGHALTASAPLLLFSSASSPAKLENSSWQAPTAILDRLLDLSKDLQLEDEVSPIQAWNYLRQHPRFDAIEVEQLRSLTIKLLAQIKCHGFGAVVDKVVFETIVFEEVMIGHVVP